MRTRLLSKSILYFEVQKNYTFGMKSQNPSAFNLATFGGRMQYSLARARQTQQGLARLVGLSKGAINQLCAKPQEEGGGRSISRIADALDVPLEWLAFNRGATPDGSPASSVKPGISPSGATLSLPAVDGALQRATLETLAKLMNAGKFTEADCIEFLGVLKPKLGGTEG